MTASPDRPEPGAGPRQIGLSGAFSIGIGGIVGGGIFATLGIAAVEAHGGAWLSLVVGGLLALLTAYSYIRLSLTFPSTGGTVTFLNRAFGEGLFAGGVSTMLVMSYIVILSLYASAFASYAGTLLPADLAGALQVPLTVGIVVLLAAVNLAGPGLVSRSEGILNAGKLGILGLFIVAGFAGGGIVWDRLGPAAWSGPMPIVAAGMLVFLSYEGFELIANASDRIAAPARTLPRAFYGSLVAALVLYVLIAVVTLGYVPIPELEAASSHVLTTAAEAVMGPAGGVLLAVGALLAAASAINGDFFGASKLPQMLAEEHEAPELADREVWGRHPVGLLTVATLAVACALFLNLRALSAVGSAGFIAVFGIVNAANARIARQTGSRRAIPVIGAAACGVALAVMVVDLLGQPDATTELGFLIGLAILPFAFEWLYRGGRGTSRSVKPTAGAR